MSYETIDTPTPIGCVVGVFGLSALAFSGFCFWAIIKAGKLDPPKIEIVESMLLKGSVAAVIALLCIGYCIHRLRTAHTRSHQEYGKSLSN